MKAQPSTPTLIVNHDRSRAIVMLFAGMLVLAAAITGSVLALSRRTPAAALATRGPTNQLLVAHCRACQDEALAVQQGAGLVGGQAWLPSVVGPPPHTLIGNCRACWDEVWGTIHVTRQAGQPVAAVPAAVGHFGYGLIRNCRACWDEALAGTQKSYSASDDRIAFPQLDDTRGRGPR